MTTKSVKGNVDELEDGEETVKGVTDALNGDERCYWEMVRW